MDLTSDLPAHLIMSGLFILQATSPNPTKTRWVKQRWSTATFVLNPPGEDEIDNMSVFYSLFFHP